MAAKAFFGEKKNPAIWEMKGKIFGHHFPFGKLQEHHHLPFSLKSMKRHNISPSSYCMIGLTTMCAHLYAFSTGF